MFQKDTDPQMAGFAAMPAFGSVHSEALLQSSCGLKRLKDSGMEDLSGWSFLKPWTNEFPAFASALGFHPGAWAGYKLEVTESHQKTKAQGGSPRTSTFTSSFWRGWGRGAWGPGRR